jgi:hypothetical protein
MPSYGSTPTTRACSPSDCNTPRALGRRSEGIRGTAPCPAPEKIFESASTSMSATDQRRRHAAHSLGCPHLYAGAAEASRDARDLATRLRIAAGRGRCCYFHQAGCACPLDGRQAGYCEDSGVMPHLILKRASASRSSGKWNDDDYDVLADGAVVGRIFKANAAPVGMPWMWTLAFGHHEDRSPTHGYAAAPSATGST